MNVEKSWADKVKRLETSTCKNCGRQIYYQPADDRWYHVSDFNSQCYRRVYATPVNTQSDKKYFFQSVSTRYYKVIASSEEAARRILENCDDSSDYDVTAEVQTLEDTQLSFELIDSPDIK